MEKTCDEARPDARARSIWRNGQNALFDVGVTNTDANSQNIYYQLEFQSDMRKKKKLQYNNRAMTIAKALNYIKSYLDNRKQRVRVNSNFSSWQNIVAGSTARFHFRATFI